MQNHPTASFGYHDWKIIHLCGATPPFAWAGTRAVVECTIAKGDEAACWAAAQRVLAQLAAHFPALQLWSDEVVATRSATDVSPLLRGWLALQAAFEMALYPADISEISEIPASPEADFTTSPNPRHALRLHSACPYDAFATLGLQLTGMWLSWSHAALQQGQLNLPREQLQRWCAGFERLSTLLPPPEVRGLHHRLWQQGISWQWSGGDKTRIGQGERQRIVTGVPEDSSFDESDKWRVPIYTVTGSVGKTTTARLLSQLLKTSGQTLAVTASDGAWVGEQKVAEGDCIGGVTARALLQQPGVQAAVFEQGRGGIVKQGVPYVYSDVAILLNVQSVHLGTEGIDTLSQMADTKALGLRPARLAVLNYDDVECRRIGGKRVAHSRIWFSTTATPASLRDMSRTAHAALGVSRDKHHAPIDLLIWQGGELKRQINLENVAPYHGLLGEKTLEELLAAVAAAWFGPLPLSIENWSASLRTLRLDSNNHIFRSSMHWQGSAAFVLDKAVENVHLTLLKETIKEFVKREKFDHCILVITRLPATPSETHQKSALSVYEIADEFICFDRPDAYQRSTALPEHSLGSIPDVLRKTLEWMNQDQEKNKSITVAKDWHASEDILRRRLSMSANEKILVLINQPTTSAPELDQQILTFATTGLLTSQ